jgi:hypothetical protein
MRPVPEKKPADSPDDLPVEWVKRRRQRNIRLRVLVDKVVVSGPLRASDRDMLRFLKEQDAWIRATHARLVTKTSEAERLLNAHADSLLIRGVWKKVMVEHVPGLRRFQWDEHPDAIRFQLPLKTAFDGKRVMAFYRELASIELPARLEEVGTAHGFTWNRVFVRSQKTKWGTCSRDRHISLNWRLIKCPEAILDYLIIHELCHTVHFNHSPAYWRLVRSHYPDVDAADRWIKTHTPVVFADPVPIPATL